MRSPRSRGTSLVEVLVLMAVGGVIVMVAIKLLHQSQSTARRAQASLDLQQSIQRLDSQLREDLRIAKAVDIKNPQTFTLEVPDASIQYASDGKFFVRSETFDDASPKRQEGFALPDCEITIQRPTDGRVLLTVKANQQLPTSETYQIEQAIGRPQ
ncbi:hypothetical protein GC197_11575 [bacterium]|nr:hypothetical protein [bacterium]